MKFNTIQINAMQGNETPDHSRRLKILLICIVLDLGHDLDQCHDLGQGLDHGHDGDDPTTTRWETGFWFMDGHDNDLDLGDHLGNGHGKGRTMYG